MTSRQLRSLIAAIAVVLLVPAVALAAWTAAGGNGRGYSKARSVAAGNTPTASVSNRNVTVSWAASAGNVPVTGYIVKRYSAGGVEQTIGANCSGTVAGTSCTENSVPPGSWRYSVTPARQNWRGAESAQSTAVTVNAPNLTLSPANVTSLPQTLTGQITNYLPGQTVSFRLDNQTSGDVLTGSITPSPVPASGTANVSVTLPGGTDNGAHTIFAIGSGGDVANAAVTVAVPTTITTSAYDLRDASAGGAEVNGSSATAFANDSRTVATGNWATSFAANRYVDFDLNSPLRPASTSSSGTINVRLATGNVLSAQGCFYIEARRASDNSVVTTYGSSGTPFCTSAGNTQTSFSIPIGAGATGAIANDVRLRVFGRTSTIGTSFVIDQASLSLNTDDGNFTLYPNTVSDAADGSAASTPWSLAFDDEIAFNNATLANWQTTYQATRYVKATFPAYVPAGATIQSVSLTHVYRAQTASRNLCYRVEAFNGATAVGTYGNTTTGVSCNTTTSDITNTISMPEVDTVAEANNLSARFHFWRPTLGTTLSRQDQARLSITYVK